MADEKEKKEVVTLLTEFRKKLQDRDALKATVTEGLKSTNSKVRSLAIKAAFKIKDHAFLKQNVFPLMKSDKSKKVLRTLSDKVTRKELIKKVQSLLKPKNAPKATEKTETPAEAPKA